MSPLLLVDDAELLGPYGSPMFENWGTRDATPPPPNWSSGAGTSPVGSDGLVVQGSLAMRNSAGSYRQGDHYSRGGTLGGGTQALEIWTELAGVASGQEFALLAMITNPNNATGNAYILYVDWSGGGGNPAISFGRRNAGTHTSLTAGDTSNTLGATDSVALVVVPGTGQTVLEYWRKQVGGSWTKLVTYTDTSPITNAGYFGMQCAGGQGFKSRLIGGGAVTATSNQSAALGTVSETDTAVAFGKAYAAPIGVVSTSETAMPIGQTMSQALGTVTVTDAAQPFTPSVRAPLGVAATTDTAQPITAAGGSPQSGALGTVTLSDVALAITAGQAKPITLASTSDTAQPFGSLLAKALSPVTLTDTAVAISAGQAKPIGVVSTLDTAQGMTPASGPQTAALGTVSTLDVAVGFTLSTPVVVNVAMDRRQRYRRSTGWINV